MRKKTKEEYINELKLKNPTVELVGEYLGTNTKTMHRCVIHNVLWEVKPASVLYGAGCSKCKLERFYKTRTKTHEKYVEDVKKIQPHIRVVGTYVEAKIPIAHYCTMHSVLWDAMPTNILHGYGCKECGNDKVREKNSKSNDQYIKELAEVNNSIISIEKYINSWTPIWHKCLVCGHRWQGSPANILYGKGCPKCRKSHGEKSIGRWLEDNNIQFISQYKFPECKNIRPLPFDFYLPKENKCIEFDGEQHFKSVEFFGGETGYQERLYHDQIKNEYCKKNSIPLLRLTDKDNIADKLKEFLFI